METGNGTNIISLVCKVFSLRADSLKDSGIAQATFSIQQLEPDVFAPPVPVPLSESLARSLIPMELYSQYTESERLFVQLATTRDWTQSETNKVLKVLKDSRFHLEDVRPDLLRRVSDFFLTHYYTLYTLLRTNKFCFIWIVQHGRSSQ